MGTESDGVDAVRDAGGAASAGGTGGEGGDPAPPAVPAGTATRRGSWAGGEWWAPLLYRLASVQRAGAAHGLLVHTVDLTGERPAIIASWPGGRERRVRVDAGTGAAALVEALRPGGPVVPPAGDGGQAARAPGPEASVPLRHAMLLEELSASSQAWSARAGERFALLRIEVRTGGGRAGEAVTYLAAERPARGDAVVLRVPPAAPAEMTGVAYRVVDRLLWTRTTGLPTLGRIAGREAFLDFLP
ncbi:hypothetical protein O4J56_12230 [Nocardiopsis sp. RSe5-2]|uniref:Uncharacterized protein n=1 Tax=Nocardiopsis endophytica TaxID=3018445 RepID=A0ABT4U3X0_9ACTN|nr:hypothetical protein [Nocardiopsis endophytica]MDA2811401.1 hypothetical protein [Nocardiopsis endophytica]